MNDRLKKLSLPKSVGAYLTDPATRAAVDSLLAVDADSLPAEIEWEEMGDYFAARAVAELTRAEFAFTLHMLWCAIWEPAIPPRWKMPVPEMLIEHNQTVSTGVIWDDQSFSVYHKCGDMALFTLVVLNRRQVTVAFSLERRDKPQIKGNLEGFTWLDDNNWDGWMLLTHGVMANADGTIDLSELVAGAKLAIAAVDAVPEPAKRTPAKRPAKSKPKPKTGRRKS